MNKLNRTSTIVLAIALTGLETFSAFAGTMPASLSMPQPIPPRFVAEAPSGLLKLFDDTSEWGADLTMRISIHDSRCSSIDPADSILLADCTRSRTLLEGEKKRYAQSLERYQRATAIFEKISDRRTLVRALDREEIELDRRLEGLRTEFSRSNERFKGYLQAIDAWLGNSAKARGGALQQARSFLLGTVMDGIHARNKALTEKAREKLARLKSSYRSTGGGKTLRKATRKVPRRFQWYIAEGMLSLPTAKWSMVISFFSGVMASGFAFGCAKDTVEFFNAGIGEVRFPVGEGFLLVIFDYVGPWV